MHGTARAGLASEHLRRKRDFVIRFGRRGGGALPNVAAATRIAGAGAVTAYRTGEHRHLALEAGQHDLSGVSFRAVLVDPLAGMQLALDVDLHALEQEPLGNISNLLVEDDDAVPSGPFLAFAGCPVGPGFARRPAEADDFAAGLHGADFRVGAQVSDQDDLVD